MNENQKPTTKTRIYNLIVLDKSGSMSSIRQAAFTGCNEVLNGIKSAAEKHADTQEHLLKCLMAHVLYLLTNSGSVAQYAAIQCLSCHLGEGVGGDVQTKAEQVVHVQCWG